MASERILGKIGENKAFIGKIEKVNKKIKKGIKLYEILIREVKLKDGKKFSHFWLTTNIDLTKHQNKKIRAIGKVKVYINNGRSSGTTLEQLKVLEIF